MCGGISFSLDKIELAELNRFITPKEYEILRKGDSIQSFYWQRRPFLPVLEEGMVHLYDWGNREDEVKLPRSGWAKVEALRDGMWDWLAPKTVIIPCTMGYERRHWFKTPRGIKAVKIRYHNITRVYLLTQKSDRSFIALTGHDRMPVGDINYLNKINYLNTSPRKLFVDRSFSLGFRSGARRFATKAWTNNF